MGPEKMRQFECIKECSQCCVEREYYPSVKYGKIGVLILPEEKQRMEKLADKMNLKVSIIPRIGASSSKDVEPEIIAYQMMGIEDDGNTCPFLDTTSDERSPHGGLSCRIYEQRPLACRAYPVIADSPIKLDSKCKFCQECGEADSNLESELESLIKIKKTIKSEKPHIWRYATGVGRKEDQSLLHKGWIAE